jgi:hypothetical protein
MPRWTCRRSATHCQGCPPSTAPWSGAPTTWGWTTARIADDLHIADDTVKSTLHHAMRALRLILQEMGVKGLDRNGLG